MDQKQLHPQEPELPQPQKSSKKFWLIGAIIAGVIVLLGIIGFVLFTVLTKQIQQRQQAMTVKPLTVGDKPYLYPCSVATREDYARSFGLDDEKVGTVTELSALPVSEIKGGGDLWELAPGSGSDPRFDTTCSYTLAKKGATQVNRIDVTLIQLDKDSEAKDEFRSKRNQAAGLYFSDKEADLPALPSFTTENSYLKAADARTGQQKAGFLVGSRVVELAYSLTDSDTSEAVTPMLDAYSKAIKAKIAAEGKSQPVDLTGRETKVGSKLVDICRRSDLSKFSSTFNDIQFRPDEMTDIVTYGSLDGSRAAADGAESYCTFDFNTAEDRQAISEMDTRPKKSQFDRPLSATARWQHKLNLRVNTYNSAAEARTALDARKASAQKPVGGTRATVEDVSSFGDAAYKTTKQSDLSLGGGEERLLMDTTLTVVKGKDLIVVSLQQSKNADDYQTVPFTPSDNQLKDAVRHLEAVLAGNRK